MGQYEIVMLFLDYQLFLYRLCWVAMHYVQMSHNISMSKYRIVDTTLSWLRKQKLGPKLPSRGF